MIAPVSISELISLTNKMCGPGTHRAEGVAYEMGAKTDFGPYRIPFGLKGDSNDVTRLDCSGFVRFTAAKCSEQRCILPDGSATMHEFCRAKALLQVRYTNCADDTDKLFLAFIAPTRHEAGHVWWVQAGQTLECHAGAGVDCRSWNTPVLLNHVAACYVFPIVP